jgi:5'-3' exoribonuclease 2
MGIPFYFSYLIKNHREVLKKYSKHSMIVDNLFIDANPLIYNSVNRDKQVEYSHIVGSVINQIAELIATFSPQKSTFIAFDGVAPVSKLEQQRGRRYKRRFELHDEEGTPTFNTIEITPGTPFMKYLNEELSNHFSNMSSIIYTGPNECGEGEHKIFQHIRTHRQEIGADTNVIYGLDADLIMLCLNHITHSENIYLFRETPHFIQAIDDTLEPNETYVLDINRLSTTIHSQVRMTPADYMFSCFFLGNDFLPHFPAINIRTGGVTKLMDTFKEIVDNQTPSTPFGSFVIETSMGVAINWIDVRRFVSELAKKEQRYIENEIKLRDRKQVNYYPSNTREELRKKLNDLPSYERELEKSIQPYRKGWQDRYYISLFGLKKPPTEKFIQDVCNNYLQGLEWTLKYYTGECPDWRWHYRYHYPPLLEDLVYSIPATTSFSFFQREPGSPPPKGAINEMTQLCYVLPTENLDLVPPHIRESVLDEHPEWYIGAGNSGSEEDVDFIWAFCKYFFEAHPILPEIDVDELERIVEDASIGSHQV